MNVPTSTAYSAVVQNRQLVARSITDGRSAALCSIDLDKQPTFFIHENALKCREYVGHEFVIDHGAGSPYDLLEQIALAQNVVIKRFSTWKLVRTLLLIATAAAGGYYAGSLGLTTSRQTADVAPTSAVVVAPSSRIPRAGADTPLEPASPAIRDAWDLPDSIRVQLPANLAKAAARQDFTVEYSSGHPRTIYVFADPSCPNCQRLEPALQAAAAEYNVIVFPVSVIGKDKSIANASSVLCLPPEHRRDAWARLFDAGRDILPKPHSQDPQAKEDNTPADCAQATKALGVNDVAYNAYRIPGTPWAISDDGRHVPQSRLRDLSQLKAFIARGPADDAK